MADRFNYSTRNASTGNKRNRKQTIPGRKWSESAKTGEEASKRARSKREHQKTPSVPKVEKTTQNSIPKATAQRVNSQAINEINAYRDSLKKNTKAITPEEAIKRNNYRRYQGQSISNSKPVDSTTAKMDSYINAGKLTKEQVKEARALIKQEQANRRQAMKSGDTQSLSNAMIPGTDEYNRYQKELELNAKVNHATARGALLPFLKATNAVVKGAEKVTNTQNTKGAKDLNKQIEAAMNMSDLAAEQSPIKHGIGNFAGNAALYSATNPIFDTAAEGLGISSAAGKFIANQVAQNAQDVVLDTLPEYQRLKDKGLSDAEIRSEIGKNLAWNAGGNLAMPFIGKGISKAWEKLGAGEALGNAIRRLGVQDAVNKVVEKTQPNIPSLTDADMKANRFNGQPTVISQLGDTASKQSDNAARVIRESQPIEEFTQNAVDTPVRTKVSKGLDQARIDLDNFTKTNIKAAQDGTIDWQKALNDVSEITRKYEGDTNYQTIQDEAIAAMENLNNAALGRTEMPVNNDALRTIDNGFEWVDPNSDSQVSVKELLDTLRGDIDTALTKELHPTTQKNVEYLRGSVDRLENAYRTGDSFDEAYEDYRKALNRVKDNMAKKEGDTSWDTTYKTLLNPKNPENIFNRYKRLSFADNVDDADLPFNDDFTMPEDTGLRRGYNIQDDNIRIDASNAESGNAGDRVIPEMEIERLTEQPDTLTTTMRERNYHASSAERGAIPEDIKQALREQDSIDRNTYAQVHNWQTEDKAIELWDNISTFDEAEEQLQRLMRDYDPATVPFARRLVSAYSKDGNTAAAMKVMDDVSESLTKAGRFTQSAVLGLAKDDPLTALRYAEKEINKINEAGSKKFGKKWKDFVLSDDEKALFNNIQPGDEAGIQDAFETIGKRIEREYPVTLREQLKEATHIGMLLNPRTMSRNVIANIPTLGMRAAGNRVEAVGQRLAHLVNNDIEVNQSLLGGGKKSRQLAKEVYNKPEIKALFDALDGKYNEANNISKHIRSKQMFKGNNPVDNFIDGMLGGYWSENGGLISKANKALGAEGNKSAMEALRGSTYKLLEMGDAPFVKENFVARLASEIKAKGWKSADDITDDAIQRALKESLEATYKDPNRLSKLLLDFKKNTGLIGEGAVPFAQTLGSIGMRSYEYSPAGALVSLGKIASAVKSGNNDAVAEGIRQLSKGITGTGMILAGIALYKSGLITGDYSDDPTIKEAQKRDGFKPYAIHLGDKYYTFDWMQPASVSGIIGIALAQAVENQESVAEGLKSGALAAGDAWFNQSAFQSLAELLGGGNDSGYGENSITRNFVDMILEMPQRLVPTSVGATARTLDRSYRDIYDQTSYLNNYKNQVMAKIPMVSEMLPQSYDAWGQPRMRADSLGEAAFQQYINPGEYSEDNLNELDSQIKAIYDEYPDKRLYPDKIPYTITSGDFNMKLNNEQHSELSRVQGGYNSELATAMLESNEFNSLPNESKAEVADQVYSVARDLALSQLYGKEPIGKNEKAIEALRSGGKQELIGYLYRTEELGNLGVSNTEKMQNLIKEGGTEAVQQYLDIQERAPKTEKGNVSKAGLMSELAKLPKDQQELMYNAFDTHPSKEESEAYAEGGASAAIEAFQQKQKEDDKEAREKAKKQNQIAREAGVSADNVGDLQKELASYGAIDSETTVKYYAHAKQTIPSLTPKQYVNNLHKIGGDDYKIQQGEMLSFFDKTNPSQEEAMKYWNAYGDWSTIPYLKKNGTWGKKKR